MFLFVDVFFLCPCMAINVSVQYNGGLTVDPTLIPSGNPFKCHQEVFYLQSMISPKRFDIFSPCVGCSEGLDAFRFFFKQLLTVLRVYLGKLLCNTVQ